MMQTASAAKQGQMEEGDEVMGEEAERMRET